MPPRSLRMLLLTAGLFATGCPTAAGDDDDTFTDDDAGDDDTSAGSIEADSFTAQLPSDAAPDGGIAVRVQHPASDAARYDEGAPVVVQIAGGWGPGALGPQAIAPEIEAHGYVQLSFLLPGGHEPGGHASGGEYDFRGPACIRATADVIRYAAGELADDQGLLLTDRLPFAWTANLGLAGQSNGGNLALQTLAEHGHELPPVAWFAAWESPIGDQYQAVELNDNPYYVPGTCTATSCPWDGIEDALIFDPQGSSRGTDWDGSTFELPGALCVDLDGSGTCDPGPGEGSLLSIAGPRPVLELPVLYPSQELSDTLIAAGPELFGAPGPPVWLAGPQAVSEFWAQADGSLRIADAHARAPDLLVIHLGTVLDHVQTQPDYPHARSHVQGWLEAGHAFVRVNPDAAYTALVSGQDGSALPDNDANEPLPYPGAEAWMVPEEVGGVAMDSVVGVAAILELADRFWAGDRGPDLNEVLLDR